jgi:hypothetical protein
LSERESVTGHLVAAKKIEYGEQNKILDALRKTRAQRGGVGAPLKVPAHLRDAAAGVGIIVTDADLDPNSQSRLPPGLERERRADEISDLDRQVDEGNRDLE